MWGRKVSPVTISELNKKAYVHIEDWLNRPLQGANIRMSMWTVSTCGATVQTAAERTRSNGTFGTGATESTTVPKVHPYQYHFFS